MKIIDRYLLRQFAHVFVICFVSLTGLYVMLDAFSHLDDFMRYAETQGSLLVVLSEYYFYKSIGFFERLSGVISLIAAMFTVAWIQRHNELTAPWPRAYARTRGEAGHHGLHHAGRAHGHWSRGNHSAIAQTNGPRRSRPDG